MSDLAARVADNLASVRERIAAAAARSGRSASAVMLVAVTKSQPEPAIRALLAAGCRDLGESRPQELWAKSEALGSATTGRPIYWHLIGHLQRNKLRRTLPLVTLIHSADSLRLIQAIDAQAHAESLMVDCLLEVNISGEDAKHGLAPHEVEPLIAQLGSLKRLRVLGLMGMAALEGGSDVARRNFAALRELRDRLAPSFPPNVVLNELSMGMSGDFEAAIEEGATIVRVGSALFAGIDG